MNRKRAVIFDLDGLLVDTEVISHQLYVDMLADYGQTMTLQEYATYYSGKTEVANLTRIIRENHLPLTLDEGMAFIESHEPAYLKTVPLKPGAKELLAWLARRGVTMVLATSSKRERAMEILQRHGVDGYFSAMVFGPEIEHGKPAPDIFLLAAQKARQAPADCLVLEDSEAGIQAAHAAGIDVICVPDMKRPAPEYLAKTAAVLDDLTQVEGVITV